MLKKTILIILCSTLTLSLYSQSSKVSTTDGTYDPDTLAYIFYSQKTGITLEPSANIKLIQTVKDWLGVPYKYGGDGRKGIDCSSFCNVIYEKVYNQPLASSSREIFTNVEAIPMDQLKEGDLIFFKIHSKRITHIGIYLGKDRFAHASRHRGVTISNLNEEYYKRFFYSGGRPVTLEGRVFEPSAYGGTN